MGQLSTFTCLVACIPTCSITWQYMGKSFQGDQVNIPILYQGNTTYIENKLHVTFSNYPTSKIEPLTCVATNTESLATITATMNLTVIDPMSVHPTSQALPVAGMSFSLQCDGPQNPASITWLKNNSPMPANERVHFSPENITMTFNPLLEEDDGLYQCVVGEGGPPIQSVGYNMQVNYGPNDVIIAGPESLEIGVTASFTCSAECSPSCSFSWTLYGKTVTGSVIDITVNRHVLKESISCQAENTLTGKTVVVNDSLSVSDPHWCGC
ncbi:carcinoembryonic antigen-related cell adhesion molecule 1-like [Micropterus dolomieu]|uniref:carcinoembryonic antigen-related cell adhesion molecule 1-like n=1 Tax=Micropterus dolomieu TaxID=147949 RepID=UPI001E8EF102|nr:carcinoembryonic antigen-related cell adhesion molecule 1-like [Micropterus dolomieu]